MAPKQSFLSYAIHCIHDTNDLTNIYDRLIIFHFLLVKIAKLLLVCDSLRLAPIIDV